MNLAESNNHLWPGVEISEMDKFKYTLSCFSYSVEQKQSANFFGKMLCEGGLLEVQSYLLKSQSKNTITSMFQDEDIASDFKKLLSSMPKPTLEKCQLCNFVADTKSALYHHESFPHKANNVDEDDSKYICLPCYRKSRSQCLFELSEFEDHMLLEHDRVYDHASCQELMRSECIFCEFGFDGPKSNHIFQSHRRSCNKQFKKEMSTWLAPTESSITLCAKAKSAKKKKIPFLKENYFPASIGKDFELPDIDKKKKDIESILDSLDKDLLKANENFKQSQSPKPKVDFTGEVKVVLSESVENSNSQESNLDFKFTVPKPKKSLSNEQYGVKRSKSGYRQQLLTNMFKADTIDAKRFKFSDSL